MTIPEMLSTEERGRRTAHAHVTQVSAPQLAPAVVVANRLDLDAIDAHLSLPGDAAGERIR